MKIVNYIDLFAGAGGLSEGFIRQNFNPVAHVEMNAHACETLKTRVSYHYLKESGQSEFYYKYLKNEIDRNELWGMIPENKISSVINKEISNENIEYIFNRIDGQLENKKVDLIIGGPPCQAYSIVGRARDPDNMNNDPRNFLYKFYVCFLEKYNPKMFVFENVPGILSAKNGKYFEDIKTAVKKTGYDMDYKVLNAKDFGVLQNRKRVILIGWKKTIKIRYPEFTRVKNKYALLEDLFSDLPALEPGECKQITFYKKPACEYLQKYHIRNETDFTTQHITRPNNERDLEIYRIAVSKWINEKKRLNYAELPVSLQTHKNTTSFLNRYQVVDPLSVSHTLVAHISCDGHYYIYPSMKQIRSISVREASRIQSFPDDFFFEGGRTAAFKQIGNAVPPLMAEAIAEKIKEVFLKNGKYY
ncbi:MAG: DNA (cytosine-5-)-methyltransferase [Euryarchaeota archaeon HGW-Euryarchaeota-1]|nr:MAG: DNA (cytosine-5-)-methyltransferase [Euryarchaeota archaeon HGW-Euryarchaeota-1]